MNVDWDLLADHLGGALDGTPEAARVARLVASDPDWARAASALSTALAAVTADLRTLPAPTMPDDVAARLTTALANAAPVPATPAIRSASGSPVATRVSDEPRRPPAHPAGGRRPRRTRWNAALAVAAGVATFAVIGLGSWLGGLTPTLPGLGTADDGGGDSGGEAADQQPDARPNAEAPAVTDGNLENIAALVLASGTAYEQETLPTTEPPDRPGLDFGHQNEPSPPPLAPTNQIGPNEAAQVVPDALLRLWTDPVARSACLSLIVASLGPPPVTIEAVDFATFEGQPALVIWATAGNGTRYAWVSGPDCGEVAGDPDIQYQTEVS